MIPREMSENPQHPGSARRSLHGDETDLLVREEPLLIQVGEQQLLTMRTPGQDLALAVGFLLSEGIVDEPAAILGHQQYPGDPAELRADTIRIRVRQSADAQAAGRLTRTHEVRPSCGICGLTDPEELLEDTRPLLPGTPKIGRDAIEAMRTEFESRQQLFTLTGACHGAALFSAQGSLLGFGEDVGRHNALDKAIGEASLAGHQFDRAIAILSGRAGYDLTMKCLRLGVPIILSVSAASALSHDLVASAGGTLVGFLRGGPAKIYCDDRRLTE